MITIAIILIGIILGSFISPIFPILLIVIAIIIFVVKIANS